MHTAENTTSCFAFMKTEVTQWHAYAGTGTAPTHSLPSTKMRLVVSNMLWLLYPLYWKRNRWASEPVWRAGKISPPPRLGFKYINNYSRHYIWVYVNMSVQHRSIWFSYYCMCNVQTFDNRTKLSSAGCWYTVSTTVLYICRNVDVLATAGVKCGPKTPPRCGCWIIVPNNLMHWLSSPHMNTCSNKNTMQWAVSTHRNALPVHLDVVRCV